MKTQTSNYNHRASSSFNFRELNEPKLQIHNRETRSNIHNSIISYLFKVPPIGEHRGQRTEWHVICMAPEGIPLLSFRRLANHMPFSSLTAMLSSWWDFTSFLPLGTVGSPLFVSPLLDLKLKLKFLPNF